MSRFLRYSVTHTGSRDRTIERAPNFYRLTTTALLAVGYPTIEAFREAVVSQLDESDLAAAQTLLTDNAR